MLNLIDLAKGSIFQMYTNFFIGLSLKKRILYEFRPTRFRLWAFHVQTLNYSAVQTKTAMFPQFFFKFYRQATFLLGQRPSEF